MNVGLVGTVVGGGDRVTTLVVVTVAVAQVDEERSSHLVTSVVVVRVLCQEVLVGGYSVMLDEVVVFVLIGAHPGMGGLGRMRTQTS